MVQKDISPAKTLRVPSRIILKKSVFLGLAFCFRQTIKPKEKQFANFAFSCDCTGDHLVINMLDSSFEMVCSASKPLNLALICQHIFDYLIGVLNCRVSDEIEKTHFAITSHQLTIKQDKPQLFVTFLNNMKLSR